MEDKLVLKNNVKIVRMEKGLSQQDLADMVVNMGAVGVGCNDKRMFSLACAAFRG